MTTEEKVKQYREWVKKCSAYEMALTIIEIDKMTVAPPAGSAYRDERTAILAGELFALQTDPKIVELIRELRDARLDEDTAKMIELENKELDKIINMPQDFFVAFRQLRSNSYTAWLEAKKAKDYRIFEPYLKQLIEYSRKSYEYRQDTRPVYDQMLDDYEPGMTMQDYDVFFAQVKERLVPLIREVTRAKQVRTDFLNREYPVSLQKEFMEEVLSYLRFDPSWGYQNETEHPFTSGTSRNDCRTTTKYLPDNVASAVLSTVHEVGHATYGHDVDEKYDGTIIAHAISSGMHESQSRLFENYLGRTEAFWSVLYPKLQAIFPEQLQGITAKEFTDAVNASSPSLIRTEADELTYPMHIVIRYELEKGLFTGTIGTDGLDQTWNRLYKEYLGVDVPDDSRGILQDVHWSDASFGYFPTYALGSAIAAQVMHTMRQSLDVDECLRTNRFDQIVDWLRENIHHWGGRYQANEILKMVTGEPFNVKYYLDYLEEKYRTLYGIE